MKLFFFYNVLQYILCLPMLRSGVINYTYCACTLYIKLFKSKIAIINNNL